MKRFESGDREGARAILQTRRAALEKKKVSLKSSGKINKSNTYLLDSLDNDMAQSEEAEEALDAYAPGSKDAKRFLKKNREVNWSKGRSNKF